MDDTSQTATPPWLSEALPEGNWHVDVDFLDRTYRDLEELSRILDMEDYWTSLVPAIEDQPCECKSVDGRDETGAEEIEETYCPKRSASQPDFNRTFLVLDRVLPRLKFAAQKLDTVITNVTKRAEESRKRWERKMQAELNQCPQTACRLERMPLEIISSIILLASQQDRRIPYTLSRVNTALRGLLLSMPLVWASLDAADPVANTKIRIQRSRNVPLTVNMWIPPLLADEEGKEKVSRFIETLEPERHRLRRLMIEPLRWEWLEHAFKSLEQRGFDFMETLHLGFAEGHRKWAPLNATILPAQLRGLSLRKTMVYGPSGSFCKNVVRLTLTEVSLPLFALQRIFRTMIALEFVLLDDIHVKLTENTSSDPILLPQLRYLVVKNSNAGLITSILDTPNLLSFQLDNPNGNHPPDPDSTETAILPAIAKRNSQLRRLHVVGCHMVEDAWTESFYNLPELEYLRIKGCHIEANHLAALRGPKTETARMENDHRIQLSACQQLEEIVFENELSIDSATVRDIVELRSTSRHTGGAEGIKWITFRGCDADLIKDEDIRAMAQLTKGITCDLIDGKEAWAENSDGCSTGSGDSWDSSKWEFESSSDEDDE